MIHRATSTQSGFVKAALAIAALLAAAGLIRFEAAAQQAVLVPGRSATGDAAAEATQSTARIRREGSSIDLSGVFRVVGDRVLFHPQPSGEALRVLENLALERIVGVLEESSGERQWKVSGMVTEYRGANYLLVRRAMITSGRKNDGGAGNP